MKHNPQFLHLVEAARSRIQECLVEEVKAKLDRLTPIHRMGLLNMSLACHADARGDAVSTRRGNVQNSSSSKAAAHLTRGAYLEYVSMANGQERRWRLFSTFPVLMFVRIMSLPRIMCAELDILGRGS